MEFTIKHPVSDDALLQALALLTSPVWTSLSVAHGLAGAPSDPWRILETFTPQQIADEIVARGLNLDDLKTACSDVLVADSPVTHWLFGYDPRPRCPQCCRPHFFDARAGELRSCGRNQKTFYPPEWRWTKTTAMAAVDGTYKPNHQREDLP